MGTHTDDDPLSPQELKVLLSTAYLDLIDRVEADVDAVLQRLHCTIEKALLPAGVGPADEPQTWGEATYDAERGRAT